MGFRAKHPTRPGIGGSAKVVGVLPQASLDFFSWLDVLSLCFRLSFSGSILSPFTQILQCFEARL